MKLISTFIILMVIWILLTPFNTPELLVGVGVVAMLTVMLYKTVNYKFTSNFLLGIIRFVVVYIPVFIYELIKANLDIAVRVIQPVIPVNPGIVAVQTKLKGDYGKLTLANSITLTPGTLSLDIHEDVVYVHCVDLPKGSNTEQSKQIAGTFEKLLGGIFK